MSLYKSLENVNTNSCSCFSLNNVTSGVNANFLANTLGVSPLYKQNDSARWQTAANVFKTSQVQNPVSAQIYLSGGGPLSRHTSHLLIHQIGNTVPTPINLSEISAANRNAYKDNYLEKNCEIPKGSLELEAIASVHELASRVQTVSVSEMLPRTSDLIFVNIKTVEDVPYTLELTMKGWRVASLHTDSMNGDYNQVDLHTRYFDDVRELVDFVSPGSKDYLNQLLVTKLSQLTNDDNQKNEDDDEIMNNDETLTYFNNLKNKPISLRSFSAPIGDSKQYDEIRHFLEKQMK
ncbi:Protein of unknown function DUF727 family and GSKIP domain-containing protein [Strongyloides ratti]|uniref:DUF727 domain-containing protein n=1 Tax=Strongyloides ratti TaxID=34506 RepID=A0A090LRI0_STRRB|nr:Protein of unknown function DUF727 family and GSKIP domain-containing protein [Strongyloides ratti]CEF70762.1 Protein of unknown function DUF727 family and GSKIP domain-containing protein [Strongyloides ratti]